MRSFSVVLLCLASSSVALADPAPAPSTSGLRNGFSLSAGQEFGGDRDISATMFGADWRIGWRVSAPISVYLHSHMSFGSATENGGATSGFTGTLATAIIGEYKLPMGVFAGAGAGFGILNNPNGPMVQARVGYYPFKTESVGKKRHLNVALDYRAVFANQGYGMVNHVAISIGYDRF